MISHRLASYWPQTLSVVRIVVALLFLEHGTAKLFGFPATSMSSPHMGSLMWTQALIEVIGGLLLAVGLMSRLTAFVLAGNMAVAYFMAHAPKGFFPLANGGDAAVLFCFVFLALFVAGPGRWSVDESLRRQ